MRFKRTLLLIIIISLVFALIGCELNFKTEEEEREETEDRLRSNIKQYVEVLKEKDFDNLKAFYMENVQFVSKSKGDPDFRELEDTSKLIENIKGDFGFNEGAKIKGYKIVEIKDGTSKDDKDISDLDEIKIVKVQYTMEDSNGKEYIIERDYWCNCDADIQGEVAYTH